MLLQLPDVETLRLCSTLASLSFALVFGVMWLGRRTEDYLLHWSASALLYSTAIVGFDLLRGGPFIVRVALLGLLAVTDVLLLTGVRRFDGRHALAPWMALVVAAPMLGYALPVALAHFGWFVGDRSIAIIGETAGIACATAAIGLAFLFGPAPTAGRGRRLVGAACLAYVVSYAGVIAQELRPGPHHELISLAPLVFDQALLGILNLGLLAIPAERAQETLRRIALRDALTGVSNRAGFERHAARLLTPGSTAIAIDVDHFKLINDTYGHDMGDDILRTLAREAAALIERAGGEFGRVGGDEFIAVLPPAVADPEFLCERLRTVPHHVTGDRPPWTISIGLARVEPGDTTLAEALKRADRSLYRAKAKGRNSVAA